MSAGSKSFAIACLAAISACGVPQAPDGPQTATFAVPAPAEPVRRVIFLIGDGTGTAYWSAAKFSADRLAVQDMPVVGLVDTRSSNARVTDSAAGATVYATGERTYNGAIGVGPACKELFARDSAAVMRNPASCAPLETVLQRVERRGWATGLVATSSVTHATPASFAAHVPYRRMEPQIAEQLAASGVDVLLGGGLGFFAGSARPDGRNLLDAACADAVCIRTAEELAAYRADDRRLIGLFAEKGMPAAGERTPSLPAMTAAALGRLARDPDGFLLVVEGSQPDWRGHDNAPIRELVAEVVDFDRAIGVALEFARATPGTLVVVTADHETGGLALGEKADTLTAMYSSTAHTAEMVPLFAYGPGAERFAGIRENYEVGRILMELTGGGR